MSNISFIVTTFNYETYIEECLQSILNQDQFDKNKVIIVDDGSQDNTYKIIKKYLSKPFIEYCHIENSGVEVAANYAINKIESTYFTRIDADDSLKSRYLTQFNKAIDLNKNYDFIYSNYSIINHLSDSVNDIKLPVFDKEEIFKRGDFLATGTLYKKEAINLINKYDTSKKNCGLENYSLILRLIIKNYSGLHIPYSLFNYRIHSNNMSKKRKEAILKYGNELKKKLLNRPYEVNCNHPYGLKID
tara:strand:- start:18 stop:755 length:738 start_codon:yes stop_codon:yes gene_type:complete